MKHECVSRSCKSSCYYVVTSCWFVGEKMVGLKGLFGFHTRGIYLGNASHAWISDSSAWSVNILKGSTEAVSTWSSSRWAQCQD